MVEIGNQENYVAADSPDTTGHMDAELIWHFKGDPGNKRFLVGLNLQLDDSERNKELLDIILNTFEGSSIQLEEEIHSEEYDTSGYTRFYIERDVGDLDDALEDEKLKNWAEKRMVEF